MAEPFFRYQLNMVIEHLHTWLPGFYLQKRKKSTGKILLLLRLDLDLLSSNYFTDQKVELEETFFFGLGFFLGEVYLSFESRGNKTWAGGRQGQLPQQQISIITHNNSFPFSSWSDYSGFWSLVSLFVKNKWNYIIKWWGLRELTCGAWGSKCRQPIVLIIYIMLKSNYKALSALGHILMSVYLGSKQNKFEHRWWIHQTSDRRDINPDRLLVWRFSYYVPA